MRWEHEVVWKEATPVLSIREKIPGPQISTRLKELLNIVYEAAGEHATGFPFAIWHDVSGEVPNQVFDTEAGTPIFKGAEGKGDVMTSHLPGGTVLQVSYIGPYDGLSNAYQEIFQWMRDNRYEPAGPPWDWYVDDPAKTGTDECRTLICWPVRVNHFNH